MASPLTHAVVAITTAIGFRMSASPLRYWILGIACAEVPDLDAVGFWFGVPYGALIGHRGLTHSILFAVVFSWVVARWAVQWGYLTYARLWCYLFLATLSHGILDAMTDGGLGVAFFSPFDQERYFLPLRPIPVSSMSLRTFLGPHGIRVMAYEFLWVWIPCIILAVTTWRWRSRTPVQINSAE
jgi:inner membrane protein